MRGPVAAACSIINNVERRRYEGRFHAQKTKQIRQQLERLLVHVLIEKDLHALPGIVVKESLEVRGIAPGIYQIGLAVNLREAHVAI
jgi:hypothetical protein